MVIENTDLERRENTDLERRVLAHERILQVLIAHMAELEPKFLDRLKEIFTRHHTLGADEQDFTGTEQYAEQFICSNRDPRRAQVALRRSLRLDSARPARRHSVAYISPRVWRQALPLALGFTPCLEDPVARAPPAS